MVMAVEEMEEVWTLAAVVGVAAVVVAVEMAEDSLEEEAEMEEETVVDGLVEEEAMVEGMLEAVAVVAVVAEAAAGVAVVEVDHIGKNVENVQCDLICALKVILHFYSSVILIFEEND